jgi:methionyl-tRNA formyltransferase
VGSGSDVPTRRVVILGKNRLAVECLRIVQSAGDEIVLAMPEPNDDGRDGWQPSFRAAIEATGLPMRQVPDINAPEAVEAVGATSPDFLLSFQAGQILRRALLSVPAFGAWNLHFGSLPRYRGVAPIAWALLNGERSTGATLHRIDPGVDSGAIVATADVPIERDDTGRSLYDKVTDAGIQLFREWWPRLRSGAVETRRQESADVLYYNRHSIDFSRRELDWRNDCERIANQARALIFPPFQYPVIRLGEREIEIRRFAWDRQPHRGRPGEILAVEAETIVVGAPGGRILLQELAVDGRTVTARDHGQLGLVTGAILSSP